MTATCSGRGHGGPGRDRASPLVTVAPAARLRLVSRRPRRLARGRDPMSFERFTDFLHRRRRLLFALWLGHAFLIHFFVLGLVSWDGLCYRLPPVIELVQHGSIGTEKYNEWAFAGYVPFVELVHLPFL